MAFLKKSSLVRYYFFFIIGYINLWPIHPIFFRILVWIFIYSISMVFNFNLCLCPSPTVPNLLLNEDELTIQVCTGDHSWSFLVILAMTMTMTIHSNSVLLMHVASAGQYESFEHVQTFCVHSTNNFDSCLCTLKRWSYCLCSTAYVLYSSRSHCILHHSCM